MRLAGRDYMGHDLLPIFFSCMTVRGTAAALATTDGQVAAHGSSIAALQSLLTTGLSNYSQQRRGIRIYHTTVHEQVAFDGRCYMYRAVKRVLERQAARVLYRGEARQTLPPMQEWRRFDAADVQPGLFWCEGHWASQY